LIALGELLAQSRCSKLVSLCGIGLGPEAVVVPVFPLVGLERGHRW
jgi:hypothetical protein